MPITVESIPIQPGDWSALSQYLGAPVVNIAQFGARGDGLNDDAIAMQKAIDALGTTGGTIEIPAGTWTWGSVPKLTAGVTGVLRITGMPGAKIQLTQAGPMAFQFNRVQDHQTFQNIEISDLLIDGGAAVIGKYAVVVGNWLSGTQIRMNFDRIAIRRVRTINVNSAGGSVATTERPNVYLIAAQSGTAEGTQNFCTRILVEDCDFGGGAHGCVIGGFNTQGNGAAGSVNSNIFCDKIYVTRVRHDTGVVGVATWASANFSIATVGTAGTCVIRDCHGINAGDPGIEADGWDYFLADNCMIEDAAGNGYLFTNFDNPRSPGQQQHIWRNCHYRRVNAISGVGWLIQNSAVAIALGHATLKDCTYYMSRTSETIGQAILVNSATAGGLQSLTVDNFHAVHKGFSYSGGGNVQWSLITVQNLTGTTRVTINGLKAVIAGTRAGAGQVINSILYAGGGTLYLDLNNIEWSSDVVNQTNDTHWAFVLGNGYTTTLHGSARRIKPTSITADLVPRLFFVYDTSTLTISPDFRLAEFDAAVWPVNGVTFRYQTGTQNSDKMVQEISPRAVVLPYSASMTPDAAQAEYQTITVTNGTAFAINAPLNATIGARLALEILNSSGGAMGAATWNAVFKMAAFVAPGNTLRTVVQFRYNGTNWVQQAAQPAAF